jgi:hypothetical protein
MMRHQYGKFAALFAGVVTVAGSVASAETQTNLGLTWMVMILGVASIGAVVRGRRAKGLSAADL